MESGQLELESMAGSSDRGAWPFQGCAEADRLFRILYSLHSDAMCQGHQGPHSESHGQIDLNKQPSYCKTHFCVHRFGFVVGFCFCFFFHLLVELNYLVCSFHSIVCGHYLRCFQMETHDYKMVLVCRLHRQVG